MSEWIELLILWDGLLVLPVALAARFIPRPRFKLSQLGPMMLAERKRRGMSQVKVGAQCGLTSAQISRFESGHLPHSIDDLQKGAQWLGREGREFL